MRRHHHSRAKLERLRRCELFEASSDDELAEIAGAGDELQVPAGRKLTRQGRPAREVFVILGGICRVLVDGVEITQLGGGDIVGELGVLDKQPRSATVIASTPVDVLAFDPRSFAHFIDQDSIRLRLLEQLVGRLRHGDESLTAG